jgi:hypothetical protein
MAMSPDGRSSATPRTPACNGIPALPVRIGGRQTKHPELIPLRAITAIIAPRWGNTRNSCAVNVSSPLETKRSFTGDGGRPPEVGLQGQASNRHKLRR